MMVLVTGATGFVGSRLTSALASRGDIARVTTRSHADPAAQLRDDTADRRENGLEPSVGGRG